MKIIIVGAGVLGASVARSLALAGEDVLLLDRSGQGRGTSATTFAWTNANRKHDPAYQRLNVAGMAEHAVLADRLPGPRSYFRSGSLHCADPRTEPWLTGNVELLRSLDYPARWVERAEAEEIAGDVVLPEATTAIAHFPSEGYVLPELLMRSLLDDAERHGAEVSLGEVVDFGESQGKASVTLSGGEIIEADRVVLAAGRWTDALAAKAGIDIPMMTDVRRGSPIVGLLGYVTSPRLDLKCVLHTPSLNLRPAGNGHTVVQALDLNARVDPSAPVDPETAAVIAERFSAMTDAPGRPEIGFRVAIRSMPADGHTIAGPPSPGSRIYCLVTHSGITLAPILGRLAAEEIVSGETRDLLDSFRPGRFAGLSRSDLTIERPVRLGEQ
ncbi:NAD(P)/FAD-dependent oxidoreductase [Amycolatopsis regifaucium]|uniref:Fructosyl-amino acid oxidase n=1 Tax=Amycolatopsis regifaucium TaxID=546365 RepID=A0A154M3Q8_9PSEU|nr:FAD-binding oxidoreductase [Amycolatopsis regifaucium]KZB79163.1 fructosyl-amino acid oxidase [Amycolatopsis regifaucium]OKA07346.1 fructosyl-amino acid oxidase [Amycolatopsis regifaucium]SFH13765.1 Glycine/D-amino acid oxidase [Amycolatopsis regifaucium]